MVIPRRWRETLMNKSQEEPARGLGSSSMAIPSPAASDLNAARRLLFRGVYGGVGVLMAVQAKTALGAGTCASVSATMSGNTSPRPSSGITCSGGLSPGFWKVPQHFNSWSSTGAVVPTFKKPVGVCLSGMTGLTLDVIKTQGTLLTNIGFAGAPPGVGIWAVLAFPGSFAGGQLLRHLAAAWLNAGYFVSVGAKYPLTRVQIVAMWNATKAGGAYCPTGITCGVGWSAADVINYINGMYDVNASGGDPAMCYTN